MSGGQQRLSNLSSPPFPTTNYCLHTIHVVGTKNCDQQQDGELPIESSSSLSILGSEGEKRTSPFFLVFYYIYFSVLK